MPAFEHDLILEGLNQIVSSPLHKTGKMKYSSDNFEDVSWGGIPMIFADGREHIDWQKYIENPDKELKRRNASIIGYIRSAWVRSEPAPQLDAHSFVIDTEAHELVLNGNMGLSTDFVCDYTDSTWEDQDIGELVGTIRPNYVHCWKKQIQNEQNDIVARFMNATPEPEIEEIKMDTEISTRFDKLEAALSGFFSVFNVWKEDTRHMNSTPEPEPVTVAQPTVPETVPIVANPVVPSVVIQELESAPVATETPDFAELQAKIAALEAEAKNRLESEATAKQTALENSWNTVKTKFQPGVMHEEGSEDAMRKLYLEDAHAFILKYGDLMNLTDAALDRHMNSAAGAKQHQNSADAPAENLSIGSYDAITGGWI